MSSETVSSADKSDSSVARGFAMTGIPVHAEGPPHPAGLPAKLRAGIEHLSGFAMDDVRVHRDSSEPARLGALAFARGSDIHLGPGQDRHLPHEAWHVVQQKQGRVQTTTQMKGMAINDDARLEREADRIGATLANSVAPSMREPRGRGAFNSGVIQRLPRNVSDCDTIHESAPAMQPSQACIDLVKQFESCAKERSDGDFDAYPDPATGADPWTIGWGSTGPDIKQGLVWTQKQCDDRFAEDIATFASGVADSIGGAATTQNQFDALVSFAYNAGLGGLKGSTLLKKHKAGDFTAAAKEFAKWVNAGGKKVAGLVTRRAAEAKLYEG